MCCRGDCPNELDSGKCGGFKHGPCPEGLEPGEDYFEALEQWRDGKEEAAEYAYEMMEERMEATWA
jgi:hypothetical protein